MTTSLRFGIGYIAGAVFGLPLGLLMGDTIGWIYITGTIGCFVAVWLDKRRAE
jgi:predicted MFS family arabinose efflux permease